METLIKPFARQMATENALWKAKEHSTYSVFRTCDARIVMRKNTINSPSRPMMERRLIPI